MAAITNTAAAAGAATTAAGATGAGAATCATTAAVARGVNNARMLSQRLNFHSRRSCSLFSAEVLVLLYL